MVGGRSGVTVVLVRLGASHQPVIMKVAPKEQVLEELSRFQSFVKPFDDELRPQPFIHGKAALILFGLVPSIDDQQRPAEMMEEALELLWNQQLFCMMPEAEIARRADNLGEALMAAATKLLSMNRRRPDGPAALRTYANPRTVEIDRLEGAGLDAGLGEEATIARRRAFERMTLLERAGVVHGDLHLGNILVRGDRTPHLIDYAGSGPGHPAVDLVRLEVALFTGPLRQLASEGDCAKFQHSMTLERLPEATLVERFPELYRSHVNRACLQGCVAAREAAIAAVSHHRGGIEDYLAVKYMVAWQVLHMPRRHSGMARAIIQALAPTIASWPLADLEFEEGVRVSDRLRITSG
jgi:tRNA A-37 threonylcarbamoyl transferase component Bud32